MFTRRHYEAVARELAQLRIPETSAAIVALALADVFASDNPCFDRARFLTACGFPALAQRSA